MKKYISILICVFIAIAAYASPVSKERAYAVAKAFVGENSTKTNIALSPRRITSANVVTKDLSENDSEYFYVFSRTDGKGDIIVAADDCAYPILGYTDRPLSETDRLPANLKWWLDGYRRQIQYARDNGLQPSSEITEQWNQLTSAQVPKAQVIIAPLVSTNWDQDDPYNRLTPDTTPTGCVATAMAQVMKYWEYPLQGNGSRAYKSAYGRVSADFENTTYDWNHMPRYITTDSPTEEIDAVSTLMYHCGVASSMEYGPMSSGTYVIEDYSRRGDDCAEYALKTYFGYKTTMHGEMRDYYSAEEWNQMVIEEMYAGRPLLYSGYGDEGGHAFICDGYRNDGCFHFNWGWSGYGDGFYALNALVLDGIGTGGGDGHFNYLQHALFGVEPDRIETITPGRYDLQMASTLVLPESRLEFFTPQDITFTAQIKNCGELDFSGVFYMILTDSKGNILDTIPNYSVRINSTHRAIISLSYSPERMLTPDVYTFTLYYRDSGLRSGLVGDSQYANVAQLEIYYTSLGINAISEITIGEEGLHSKKDASVGVTIKNIDGFAYSGQVRMVLIPPSFDDISQILTTADFDSLPAGETRQIQFDGMINVKPGTYMLALQYYHNGSWNLVGSEQHFNPVWVQVEQTITSVDDVKLSFAVYPNPATDYIVVSSRNTTNTTITISDLSGRRVVSCPAQNGNTTIDVSELPTGLYILTMENSTAIDSRKLIIK